MSSTEPPPSPKPTAPLPQPQLRQASRRAQWLIWLIPTIALAIGLWLGVKSVLNKGPTITISFLSAAGLEAGKTKIRYKHVDIGLVKAIRLTPDHKKVEISAELRKFDGVDRLLVAAVKLADGLELGYLGVDFVLDVRHGPVVLEANARPGLAIQVANRCGLHPRIKFIDSQPAEMLHPDRRLELVPQLAAMGYNGRRS